MTQWEPVIGLEVHVQLATASKAFSASANAFGGKPNSLTDPTVLGLPGALPVFNHRALELAIRLGIAVGGSIRERCRFARKQYFYPDLPKGYQISQFDEPLIEGGVIEIYIDGEFRSIPLTRIHLEEDAGKSSHSGGSSSLVDLNRAGVPLCEVVSDPALGSATEAGEYMRALRRLVRVLEVSDGDMEKGQLRCDANVSLRPVGDRRLGTRVELKNINSFRFVQDAIEFEIARQSRVLDGGGTIAQETRLWDVERGISVTMRGKEDAHDYRYFPDPDLPPVVVTDDDRAAAARDIPELPEERRRRLFSLGLSADEASILIDDSELARFFDATTDAYAGTPEGVAKWLCGELQRAVGSRADGAIPIRAHHFAELLERIDDGTISRNIARAVLEQMVATGNRPDTIIEEQGLRQIADTAALETIIAEIIARHPRQAEQYRQGKLKLKGFFVGQTMKATAGRANPEIVGALVERLLLETP